MKVFTPTDAHINNYNPLLKFQDDKFICTLTQDETRNNLIFTDLYTYV